jgi:NTP pyrophosphatase (non-canonical NTP hydrolase)
MNNKEYLLALLTEECCEVAQAANKCIRFTTEHAHYATSNLERLQVELIDLFSVLELLEEELKIVFEKAPSESKIFRIKAFMEISRKMGTLT